MGLFKSRNQKIFEDVVKEGIKNGSLKTQKKTVTCPKCGQRYTCTFIGSNDSKTCKCGYKIYCN